MDDKPEILSVEWTHRHYVQDDEYIPHGEDIEAFLKREIAKPIIRWEDSPQLGYEILPNKYFYRYQPPTPAKDLLAEFWRLEKEAEKMLEGLGKKNGSNSNRTLARARLKMMCDGIRSRASTDRLFARSADSTGHGVIVVTMGSLWALTRTGEWLRAHSSSSVRPISGGAVASTSRRILAHLTTR